MADYPNVSWSQQRLADALKSPDPLTKIGALRAIQEVPREEYARGLIDALEDPDRLVRVSAALALGRARSPVAVPALVRHAASDPDREVQSYALWAYRQIDYGSAVPQLIELLADGAHPYAVQFAANEIRQKGDVKAIEAIAQRFRSRKLYTGFDLDIPAVNALYEIGNIVVEPLVKCLDDPDVRVQVNAIYTLGKIGDERAVAPLIARLAPASVEIRSRISDALIKIGAPAVPELVKLVDSPDRDLKWIAAYTLGGIGEAAEPALLKALEARGSKPGEEAVYALGLAGGARSFGPLYAIYGSTRDDSVKAWSIIALANLVARRGGEIPARGDVGQFMDQLSEQLKPHMLLSYQTLLLLGKAYALRARDGPDRFAGNLTVAVKCFDLSLIEQENIVAKAYRLFFGSYLKLMTSKSPEIMSYVEKDFADLRKDAEKTEQKKEITLGLNQILQALRTAYGDRNFPFLERFGDFADLCLFTEQFMPPEAPAAEAKKLGQKESAKLHSDVEIVQRKITTLIGRLGALGDADAAAQALRLSAEVSKIDTGTLSDYRAVESCLRNIVARLGLPADLKSELYFKILLIGKNGIPQADVVLEQVLKTLKAPEAEEKQGLVQTKAEKSEAGAKSHFWEYLIIAALIVLIVLVLVVALNKFGVIVLPFRFPIDWLNPALAAGLL